MTAEQFSVGDRVRIRDWDDMEDEFGTDDSGDINVDARCYFVREMRFLCGQECTITEVRDEDWTDIPSYDVDIDREGFILTPGMLVHVDDAPCAVDVDMEQFVEFLIAD